MKCFESYFDARKKFGNQTSEEIIGKTGEQKKLGKTETENGKRKKKERKKEKKKKKKKRKKERRKFF